MGGRIKKLFAGILCLAIIAPGTIAYADNKENQNLAVEESASDSITETSEEEEEEFIERTEKEALKTMELVAENENLEFYACIEVTNKAKEKGVNPKEKGNLFAVRNKISGYIWWSSPINVYGDQNAATSIKRELASAVVITYGIPKNRTEKTLRSANKASTEITKTEDGVKVLYTFRECNAGIPVEYTLCEDYLKVRVDVENITEEDISPSTGMLLTSISVFGSFGAASEDEEGSFVIPDGSGAIINFNNGKTNLRSYSSKVYGADTAQVPKTKPAATKNVYMPVYGIIKGSEGVLAVIESGDANVTLNASVSRQSKSSYNICGFRFMLRGSESYLMNGESSEFTVFEHGKIKTHNIEIRYYPIMGEEPDFTDIALRYREYLENEKKVKAVESSDPFLYVNFYGGVEKKKSILGFPITLKTEITGFDNAKNIIESMSALGADNMVITYDNWTDDGIKGKVDNEASPSKVLGGKSDFKELLEYVKAEGHYLYPSVNNKGFVSGNGYFTFKDTAARISGSYSKLITYDRAFGIENTYYDPVSLLSPLTFNEVYSKLAESYGKSSVSGVSLGEMTCELYGDYGKDTVSRDSAMDILKTSYEKVKTGVGSVLADTANAYAFESIDHIINVPLTSSRYDLFDEEIPFYQVAVHGLLPYSSPAVNADADYKTLMLKALAAGADFNFDMIYSDPEELKNTKYDIYYYAWYKCWMSAAADAYKLSFAVLNGTGSFKITDYKTEGDIIETVYENGTKTIINLKTGDIDVNGKTYNINDYLGEGAWDGL